MILGSVQRAGETAARDAVRARVVAIAAEMRAALPGSAVAIDGDSVIVRGTGLVRRWLDGAALRFIGSGL